MARRGGSRAGAGSAATVVAQTVPRPPVSTRAVPAGRRPEGARGNYIHT